MRLTLGTQILARAVTVRYYTSSSRGFQRSLDQQIQSLIRSQLLLRRAQESFAAFDHSRSLQRPQSDRLENAARNLRVRPSLLTIPGQAIFAALGAVSSMLSVHDSLAHRMLQNSEEHFNDQLRELLDLAREQNTQLDHDTLEMLKQVRNELHEYTTTLAADEPSHEVVDDKDFGDSAETQASKHDSDEEPYLPVAGEFDRTVRDLATSPVGLIVALLDRLGRRL
eukprot:Clim_evm93s147 gene=Clim_evmTU93s147